MKKKCSKITISCLYGLYSSSRSLTLVSRICCFTCIMDVLVSFHRCRHCKMILHAAAGTYTTATPSVDCTNHTATALCKRSPVVYSSNSRTNCSQCFLYSCCANDVHAIYTPTREGGIGSSSMGAKKPKCPKCLQIAASRASSSVPGA